MAHSTELALAAKAESVARVIVDGGCEQEFRPDISCGAASGERVSFAPSVGADSERGPGADDLWVEVRLGSGVSVQ